MFMAFSLGPAGMVLLKDIIRWLSLRTSLFSEEPPADPSVHAPAADDAAADTDAKRDAKTDADFPTAESFGMVQTNLEDKSQTCPLDTLGCYITFIDIIDMRKTLAKCSW